MRSAPRPEGSSVVYAALAVLVAIYLATVLPHLGDDPIVGGDEGWIMSASAKLAEHGVFGSDLFAGFYGVDEHYFFNFPLHHIILAGVFKVAGVGIEQARFVSVAFGLATLLLTYALGARVGGRPVALGGTALLVLLRLNLTPFSGLTLTDLGATVRYDLIAVPYGLAASLLVLAAVRASLIGQISTRSTGWARGDVEDLSSRSIWLVAGAGVFLGLGALTQFIGAFVAIPLALFLLTEASIQLRQRLVLIAIMAGAAMLTFAPYAVYTAANWSEFRDQSRSFDQSSDFTSPSFYLDQLRHEPDRYAIGVDLQQAPSSFSDAASRPSARLVFFLLGPAALIYTAARARAGASVHRLLAIMLVALIVQLALFESTKRFVYWVVVVPYLCIALADLGAAVLAWRPSDATLGLLARVAVAAVAGVIAVEGVAVAVRDVLDAGSAPSYEAAGADIRGALPIGAGVLGDNRLWPLLHEQYDQRSLLLLFYLTNTRISRDRATDVFGVMQRLEDGGVQYVLLSPLSREILTRLTPEDAADFERYLSERTRLVTTVAARGYGPIEVYQIHD